MPPNTTSTSRDTEDATITGVQGHHHYSSHDATCERAQQEQPNMTSTSRDTEDATITGAQSSTATAVRMMPPVSQLGMDFMKNRNARATAAAAANEPHAMTNAVGFCKCCQGRGKSRFAQSLVMWLAGHAEKTFLKACHIKVLEVWSCPGVV
eukprot:1160791-Pelagomonas_calceolata.AAC.4